MRQWIGLIIVGVAGYYLWTQYGDALGPERVPPATPEVAWYLDNVRHHFTIVPERGAAWFWRGFHENTTTKVIVNAKVKIFMRQGEDWQVLDTFQLGVLEPEQRETFDRTIRVPKDVDEPKLRWEMVSVNYR